MGLSVVPIGCKPTAEADDNKTFKSLIHSVKRVRCGSFLCTCARDTCDVNGHQPTLLLVSALPKKCIGVGLKQLFQSFVGGRGQFFKLFFKVLVGLQA